MSPSPERDALNERYRLAVLAYQEAIASLEGASGDEIEEAKRVAEAARLEIERLRKQFVNL